jgi:hypothetical protein
MSSVTSQKQQAVPEMSETQPLDEVVWQAWIRKGRAQEARSYAVRVKCVKWALMVGLLAAVAAGFWHDQAPYGIVTRFLITMSAMALTINAFQARHDAFAGLFGAMALLYNPLAPVLSFAGEWQRWLVLASAVPIAASLTFPNAKLVPNV